MNSQHSSAGSAAVPLFDLQRQHTALRDEIRAAVMQVCDSTRFIFGPECQQLEEQVASYSQARYGVACASGSDALLLALMACDIGPGDDVLVPSYTFFATASAVWRLGARPVFVDIDPDTYNIDPQCVAAAVTPRAKAIIPVHLFGQCADMDAILAAGRNYGLTVIEDAAQAIGAEYQGRRAGSMGHMSCFSFYPTKNLGGAGDGGMLTTNDEILAAKLRLLRGHGMEPRYYHQVVGINSRLDSLQAAVLNVKLPHLDAWTELRAGNARRYEQLFTAHGLERFLSLPTVAPARRHVWNQYVVRVAGGKRDALRKHLTDRKIGTEIYYPLPLHQQACFASLQATTGPLPETERAARETLALPIFPELQSVEQDAVVVAIADFFGAARPAGGHSIPRPKHLAPSPVRQNHPERR
ncbi:MAG: DegT/DnrJ/EryC1/StrS family aminotransferase [Pirellulales bacterium]|nr:DegT/DnrJ/EryC1/StrS family aminotransferase [Pirellulales bacterium]